MTETATAALEVREASTQEGRHTVEALVVPYGQPTTLADIDRRRYPGGEAFAPGAFAELLASPSAWPKVRLTDTHPTRADTRRPVAKGALFADATDGSGLLGRFQFFDTPEGRGAFENVAEGTYGGVSVGFAVARGGEEVREGVRVIRTARLHHVALVDEPAYESAQVLATRAARDAEDAEAAERAERDAVHDAELRAFFAAGYEVRTRPTLPRSFRDLMG